MFFYFLFVFLCFFVGDFCLLCVASRRCDHLERRLFSVAQGVPALAEHTCRELVSARVRFTLVLGEQHEAAQGLLGSVRITLLLDTRLACLLATLARGRGRGGGNAQRSHLLRKRLELLGELVDLEGKGLCGRVGGRRHLWKGWMCVCMRRLNNQQDAPTTLQFLSQGKLLRKKADFFLHNCLNEKIEDPRG